MAVNQIIEGFKKRQFKPVYWLEGEEPYFIDQVMHYAEKHLLTEAEAAFNLTILYGRETDWATVVNACRRYPMFSEKHVVLLKEAQSMRDIAELGAYFENPSVTTLLVVGYKEKKLDGRSRMAKAIKECGELVTTKKPWDNELPQWVDTMARQLGLSIEKKANELLVGNIGNDLSRLANELNKVSINLHGRKQITVADIEAYVGISREYNVMELQTALVNRELSKCLQIAQYMEANPKSLPLQMVLPTLYTFFSKAYLVFGAGTNNPAEISKLLGYSPGSTYFKDVLQCARLFRQRGVEHAILLLHECNLRSIGIGNSSVSDAELLKEMVVKMIEVTQMQSHAAS